MLQSNITEVEKFKALFTEIPAALALLQGPEFIFEMANLEYCQLVGRTDVVGKTLLEALPEIKDQPFPSILSHVFSTGDTFQAREVEVLLTLDAENLDELTRKYVDVTYRRIVDSNGAPYGIFVFAIDVTEKVNSRQIVHLERQKLEAVFANASASLAILRGPELTYENANTSYLNLFNNRKLVGKPLLEALPELSDQKFPDLMSQVFETGVKYVETEARASLRRTPESPLEERYFDQSYTRIGDQNDHFGILIQAVDVTERVNSRRQLAESAERFKTAVEAANMGTWEVDVENSKVNWSPRSAELFNFDPGEVVSIQQVLARIHSEDRETVNAALTAALDPTGNGNFHMEYRIPLPDGNVRWVTLRGRAIFAEAPNGSITTRMSGTILDITDRALSEQALRGSERQFRMMADVMPQIVWTARHDGVLDYTNKRWSPYSGSSDPQRWLEFIHEEDFQRVVEVWNRSVKTGDPYSIEFRLRRESDQSYRWFLGRAYPSFDSHGKIERWFGTWTDIEEQKAALAARSEFMSIASHELKTPLTSLKLQTQSMRRNFDKGKVEAFSLEKVALLITNNEKQVGRLVRLVDDMLDFAKIESGKMSMSKELSDIGALVSEVHEHLREQLEAAKSPATLSCDQHIFGMVDRFRIEQVITNLLTNAIRYGNAKPITIEVTSHDDKVLISISDQGMGIGPENLERIFNRFERGISANEVSGLGLGLYISRQIIEDHQGRIWVVSDLNKGSTFYVELPREKNGNH